MPVTVLKDYHVQLLETIREYSSSYKWWSAPLNLGGSSGTGGGSGTPVGGIFGQLIQSKVAYDTSELAYPGLPSSGVSIIDNLAHIRYDIDQLESLVGSGIVASGYWERADTHIYPTTISDKVSIGAATVPDGNLHIFEGSAGSVTADTSANTIVLESDTDAGMSILTPDGYWGGIYFGSPSYVKAAWLSYNYSSNTFGFEGPWNGKMVFNSLQYDIDYYWGWDGGANAIFLEGSTGNVGIGTATFLDEALNISGNLEFQNAATISTTTGDLTLDPAGDDVFITASTGNTAGLYLDSDKESGTIGKLVFRGHNTTPADVNYASWQASIASATPASERGELHLYVVDVGSFNSAFTFGGGENAAYLQFRSQNDQANDQVGFIQFYGRDSVPNNQSYAFIRAYIEDPTSTQEDGQLRFSTFVAGSDTERIRLDATNIKFYDDLAFQQASTISTTAGDLTLDSAADIVIAPNTVLDTVDIQGQLQIWFDASTQMKALRRATSSIGWITAPGADYVWSIETSDNRVIVGSGNTYNAKFRVDQGGSTASIPALYLHQRDYSEQAIIVSYNAIDQDMILIELNVTGTPQFNWKETPDMFDMSKGLQLGGDLDFQQASTISTSTGELHIESAGNVVSIGDSGHGMTGELILYKPNASARFYIKRGDTDVRAKLEAGFSRAAVGSHSDDDFDIQTDDVTRIRIDNTGSSVAFQQPTTLTTTSGSLTIDPYENLILAEQTAPAGTPSTGYGYLYADSSDSKLYWKSDGGTSYDLTSGAAESLDLDDLADVTITTPIDGNTLYYEASSSEWKNTNLLNTKPASDQVTISGGLLIDGNLDFQGAQSITTTAGNLTLQPTGNVILDPGGGAIAIVGGTNTFSILDETTRVRLTSTESNVWFTTTEATYSLFNFFQGTTTSSRSQDAYVRVWGDGTGSEYIQMFHDGTDGTIQTAAGDIILDPNSDLVVMDSQLRVGSNDPGSTQLARFQKNWTSDPGADAETLYTHIAINTAAARDFYAMTMYALSSHAAGTVDSVTGGRYLSYASGAGNTTSVYGIQGTVYSGGGTQSTLNAGYFSAYVYAGTPTITRVRGLHVAATLAGATLTDFLGLFIQSPSIGAGSVANVYGVKIEDISIGGTLNYSVYTGTGTVSLGDDLEFRQAASITTTSGDLTLDPAEDLVVPEGTAFGLGIAAPTDLLHVYTTAAANSALHYESTNQNFNAGIKLTSGTDTYQLLHKGSLDYLRLLAPDAGTIMVWDNTRAVGIGGQATAPYLLDVGGETRINQAGTSGGDAALTINQADVSEQAIVISYGVADVDMILMELDVTGTPQFNWKETPDMFDMSKGLQLGGDLDFQQASTISTTSGDLTLDSAGNTVLSDATIIDVTSTEALLVRKDADGGDVLAVDTTNSRVGILGTNATATAYITQAQASSHRYILFAFGDTTDHTATHQAVGAEQRISTTTASGYSYMGFQGGALANNATANLTGKLIGINAYAGATATSGTLTISDVRGVDSYINHSSANTTIAIASAFYARDKVGAGTITDFYGLYIESMTGGASSNYAIYTNAGTVSLGDDLEFRQASTISTTTGDLTITPAGSTAIGSGGSDGTLHVHTASAGTVTAHTNYDDLVIENSGNTGLSILAPDASYAGIYFGFESDNASMGIQATYNDELQFISRAGIRVTITNNLFELQSAFTVRTSGGNLTLATLTGDVVLSPVGGNIAANSDLEFQQASTISTTSGDLTLNPTSKVVIGSGVELQFATEVADKIYLYSTTYGIGVSAAEFALWSNSGAFRFRQDTRTGTIAAQISGAVGQDTYFNVLGDNFGIGIASPDGKLHVHTATAGSVAASASMDDLVVENSGAGGISVLTPNDAVGYMTFGSPANANYHYIGAYGSTHATLADTWEIFIAGGTRIELTTSGMEFQQAQTISTTSTNDLTIDPGGDLEIGSNTIIGSTTVNPDGTLHVHTATAGTVTAGVEADDLIVENSGDTGISILGPDANWLSLNFGSPTQDNFAYISAQYNSNAIHIRGLQNVDVGVSSSGNSTGFVWNDSGYETDFRIESNSEQYAFYVVSSTGTEYIYIGGNSIATADATFTLGGGLVMGNPTGADKGAGTINVATDVYKNDSAYANPDFVLEHYYNREIVRFIDNPGAKEYTGLMSIKDTNKFMKKNLSLPWIENKRPSGMFERGDMNLEGQETLMLYIIELEERLAKLEKELKNKGDK
jgi:hypothetical protein